MLWNSRGHVNGQGQGHGAARWDLGPRCAGLWSEGLAGLQVGSRGQGQTRRLFGWGTPGVTGVEAERKDPGLPHGVPVQWSVPSRRQLSPWPGRSPWGWITSTPGLGLGAQVRGAGRWLRAPQNRQGRL